MPRVRLKFKFSYVPLVSALLVLRFYSKFKLSRMLLAWVFWRGLERLLAAFPLFLPRG